MKGRGNLLLFKLLKNYYGLNKYIYAFDNFDGMTFPNDNLDKDYLGIKKYIPGHTLLVELERI